MAEHGKLGPAGLLIERWVSLLYGAGPYPVGVFKFSGLWGALEKLD